jgi:hypothetical protein
MIIDPSSQVSTWILATFRVDLFLYQAATHWRCLNFEPIGGSHYTFHQHRLQGLIIKRSIVFSYKRRL